MAVLEAPTGTLSLREARLRAAEVLRGVAPLRLLLGLTKDPVILADMKDSVDPPVLLVGWLEDNWLEGDGNCRYKAALTVLALSARLDPTPAIEDLEALVSHTLDSFHADAYQWGHPTVQAPRGEQLGGIPYLGARITFRVSVTTLSQEA